VRLGNGLCVQELYAAKRIIKKAICRTQHSISLSKAKYCIMKTYPFHHAVKSGRGCGGMDPRFLTSALGGGEWSASRHGRFIPQEYSP